MNRWGKVLRAICEEAKERGVNLYILEGDESLNWFGFPVKEVCFEENFSKEDTELFKEVKAKAEAGVQGNGYIAYVSPLNFFVDIYESDRRRFAVSGASSRPFGVTRDGFRVGFFADKEEAVNFFLGVAKRLREEASINLHLFY